MEIESLAAALEREHHEIDDGIADLKEERVLYPRADAALPPATADRLLGFLGSAELPEGWVCVRARPVTRNAGR